jgi:hypothetical protein
LNCACGVVEFVADFASTPYTDMKDGNWELTCTTGLASDGIFIYALPSLSFVVVRSGTSSTLNLLAHRFSEFEPVAMSEEVVFVVSDVNGLLRDR